MSPGADLVPLIDRLAGMQRARVMLACVVVGAAALVPDLLTGPVRGLVPLSGLYVLLTSSLERLRRLTRRRGLQLVFTSLVVDGLYLAVVVIGTGGADSRLLFLVHVHVVACALLLSFRSGLIASIGHGVLLFAAGDLDVVSGPVPVEDAALAGASFLLVAVASAVFASLNERELECSRRAATSLVELGDDLERCRTAQDVALVGAGHLRARLGHSRAGVLLRHDEGWIGACDSGAGPVAVESPGRGDAVGPVHPEPLLLADLEETDAPLLTSVLPDARHVVVAPLLVEGERTGVAAVECGLGRSRLASPELELLEQSVARMALALHTVSLLREIERLAASDALTGLPNRRLFDSTLERELARSRRSGRPLALAIVDVDRFKAVNDEHGHQAGDAVLCELADELRGAVRQEDVVARYGGEEFVVLLPDAQLDAALIVAERLRLAARRVRHLPITISLGVAALDADDGATELIARADGALYQAKAEGRDRVVAANARMVRAS